MKDNFSSASHNYAQFRPTYPPELFNFLKKLVTNRQKVWDCGTGNGQVAGELSNFYEQVYATDISVQQLLNAVQRENIHYTKQPAEKTVFPDDHFDLVTVAQAVHWFNFDEFYDEVKRVLKPGAAIAVFGYGLFRSNPETDEIIDHFYREIIGEFWDEERNYLEEKYETIPFPFLEIEAPKFELRQKWSIERVLGYLNTWSAVKHYERAKAENPVQLIAKDLERSFGQVGEVFFPILLRVGRNLEKKQEARGKKQDE